MLALRLNRANHQWEAYWQWAEKQAAGTAVSPSLHHFESHPVGLARRRYEAYIEPKMVADCEIRPYPRERSWKP